MPPCPAFEGSHYLGPEPSLRMPLCTNTPIRQYTNTPTHACCLWLSPGAAEPLPQPGCTARLPEELRRATIAMEMEENGNLLCLRSLAGFTIRSPGVQLGGVVSAKVMGGYSAWALRLPTVLSILLRRFCSSGWGAGMSTRSLAGCLLLFPISGGLYFYFSLLGEIDLFYTFITRALLPFSLSAAGAMRDDVPHYLYFGSSGHADQRAALSSFLGLSVLAWLWYEGSLKRLISLAHLSGILAYGSLWWAATCWLIINHNAIGNCLQMMVAESSRAYGGGKLPMKLVEHLFMFPLDAVKRPLPCSLPSGKPSYAQ